VQLSTVQLPRIGTILGINDDGTYDQGPIPGIGGPFDTATEFFKAWSLKAQFGRKEEELRAASGNYADEIVNSVSSSANSIGKLAEQLPLQDHGPFPLYNHDIGHNNMLFNDDWCVIGAIDWEQTWRDALGTGRTSRRRPAKRKNHVILHQVGMGKLHLK
jgi:hypothetical protein